ncbi:hypothetical protein DL766_009882 [Monosporascus sp. MC13-8B]|uniref:Uncharacterized protein n=1 Tax=Monosporascus cannonballus TaxID=155416 RepID=A0ABY0GX80_9PEZI|nr:hypothetical protein DL762_009535 [Monosporascus cannonballus]RYP13100.1 hypothetical protein DL766_009882 [Monosporascus sp. MC13-8B]
MQVDETPPPQPHAATSHLDGRIASHATNPPPPGVPSPEIAENGLNYRRVGEAIPDPSSAEFYTSTSPPEIETQGPFAYEGPVAQPQEPVLDHTIRQQTTETPPRDKDANHDLVRRKNAKSFRFDPLNRPDRAKAGSSKRSPIRPPGTGFRVPNMSSAERSLARGQSRRPPGGKAISNSPTEPPSFFPPAGGSEQENTEKMQFLKPPQNVSVEEPKETETFSQSRLAYPQEDSYHEDEQEDEEEEL